jgi:serine/threonine protein kinase
MIHRKSIIPILSLLALGMFPNTSFSYSQAHIFRHFSDVFVANLDNVSYAIKTLKQKFSAHELMKNSLLNEIHVLKKLRHTHIIFFRDVFLDQVLFFISFSDFI